MRGVDPEPMRTAIVTGSNRGIGAAVADRLEEDGWRVIRNGRSAGKGRDYVRADVTTAAGAKKLAAAARDCGILVNAVGDFELTNVSDFKIDAWRRMWDSNVLSAVRMCAAVLPGMRKRKRGVVIMFGGTATNYPRGNPRGCAYVMAKSALTVFTKSLAQAEARNGIRVNMVNPGFIRTYAYTEADVREMAPKVPMGRLGTPEEVANAVSLLASDDSSYITGAVLDVGGGLWI